MKINLNRKVFIILFFLVVINLFSYAAYAVDLEFPIMPYGDSDDYVMIRVFANAYQGSIDYFDSLGVPRNKLLSFDEENKYVSDYGYRTQKGGTLYNDRDHYITPKKGDEETGFDYVGTSLNYSSAGIQFQKGGKKTSSYTYSNGSYPISYAQQLKSFSADPNEVSINLAEYITGSNSNYDVSPNYLNSDELLRYDARNVFEDNILEQIFGGTQAPTFHAIRWTITDTGVSVSDWLIPKDYLNQAIKRGFLYDLGDGKKAIRFSMYSSVLENCYKQYCELGAIEDEKICNQTPKLADSNDVLYKKYNINSTDNWFTSAGSKLIDLFNGLVSGIIDFFSNNSKDNADPANNDSYNVRKISYSAYEAYENTTKSNNVMFMDTENGIRGYNNNGDRSIANDYDNWLVYSFDPPPPPDDDPPPPPPQYKNVYIRHVDANTGALLDIANDTEIYVDASENTKSFVSPTYKNVYSPAQNIKYQEAFLNMEQEDQVVSTRSTTLVKDGVKYTYKGVRFGLGHDAATAESNMNSANMLSYQELTENSTNYEYVTITYYYTTSDTPPPGPELRVYSTTGSGNGCYMTYVGNNNRDVKPYIVTPTYTIKTLKYKRLFDTTDEYKPKFYIDTFIATKIYSMCIANSSGGTYKGKTISGNIIGNSRDTLFNGTGDTLALKYMYSDVSTVLTNYKNNNSKVEWLSSVPISSGTNTTEGNFTSTFTVPDDKYNGLRYMQGKVKYYDYNVINGSSGNFVDYTAKNDQYVNVSNEMNVAIKSFSTPSIIDHRESTTAKDAVIQKNAPFNLVLNSANEKYLDKYYIIFDFDIKRGDQVIRAYNWIEVKKESGNTTFTATPTSDSDDGDIVSQTKNHMFIVGMSNNVPDGYKNYVFSQFDKDTLIGIMNSSTSEISLSKMNKTTNVISKVNVCNSSSEIKVNNESSYTHNVDLYEDIYYFAWTKKDFSTVSRIYDFKVTDCLDVSYKTVFRKSTSSTTNELTGTQYYSGVKKFVIYGNSYNEIKERSSAEKQTILPLGPYKNTDSTYIFAPKLGYRISYDLKTSGYFDYTDTKTSNRYVSITPSYYYISKDAKTYKDKITLYYKNSSGDYVKLANSSYSIFFTPDDGYRYINNRDTTPGTEAMSKKLTELSITKEFRIDSTMMARNDNNFIQSWYGEYKLPNSTIAVDKDINHPLTDGYIGVKFDIKCIDEADGAKTVIAYGINNKSTNKINTSQWDYEGYLGFDEYGKEASGLKLQLEKGTWNIDNDMYQKIKGTVILYDTDSRAADDFN